MGLLLGLDLGSVSLDAVVIDSSTGKIVFSTYKRTHGRAKDRAIQLLSELAGKFPEGFQSALVTGSGKEIVARIVPIKTVNEIVAHGYAASRLIGEKTERASVIEIGGQDSKYIIIDRKGPVDYVMNELCAAGTGAFLDVQAERMGLEIEEFARLAASAENVPSIAGRCSVFAKSDIIHLQQKGTPTGEIAAGLCYALARNYLSSLVRGRPIFKPVIFQGGVAKNRGIIRAFRELLNLKEGEYIIPEEPGLMGAIGSALLSREMGEPLKLSDFDLTSGNDHKKSTVTIRSGLTSDDTSVEEIRWRRDPKEEEHYYLGIDVGSTSTDIVLVTPEMEIVGEAYLMTRGDPLSAVAKGLKFIGEKVDGNQILGVGVTGSGRKLVGAYIGADRIIDEITAQTRGAAIFYPDVDTIFEIGGQDSKFIVVENGDVKDFVMNRACAAGTGSFLQEQAYRLGIDLKREFADLASGAKQPVRMSSRCTVFMESDLVHYANNGYPLPEIVAGLAEAIVNNYIETVADLSRVGRKIVFQGGVAKNRAVVNAFRKRFPEAEIVVNPEPGLSGALGVASITAESNLQFTRFRGFFLPEEKNFTTFECKVCENFCEVKIYKFGGKKYYFGDLCGMYSERTSPDQKGVDYSERLEKFYDSFKPTESEKVIGIPEALLFKEYYPFYLEFFNQLGIKIVTSGKPNQKKLYAGLPRLPAEVCLPVKIMFGEVKALMDRGVKEIFISNSNRAEMGLMCPNIQNISNIISSAFPEVKVLALPLMPYLKGNDRKHLVETISQEMGIDGEIVEDALEKAEESFSVFKKIISVDEDEFRNHEKIALVLGKPYNTWDRFLNLSLTSKLASKGFTVLLVQQLENLAEEELEEKFDAVTWHFSRRMLKGALWAARKNNVFPVVVTNFGCGPDSFVLEFIKEIFSDKPLLILEIDEHRGDAGMETRIEAFNYAVEKYLEKKTGKTRQSPEIIVERNEDYSKFYIPYFSPHSYAFAGIFEHAGFEVEVLPLPDRTVEELGKLYSGGRQCHPFHYILGDIVNLVKNKEVPENAVYIFPTVSSQCLITQYVPFVKKVMEDLGRPDITIMGTTTRDDLSKILDIQDLLLLHSGLIAVEYTQRLWLETKPYETIKGLSDYVFETSLEIIQEGLRKGELTQAIQHIIESFQRIPVVSRGTRPVIGIVGDEYTRINPAGNKGLIELLINMGVEVWTAPTIIDVTDQGTEIELISQWREKKIFDAGFSLLRSVVQDIDHRRIIRLFKGKVRNFGNLSGKEMYRFTEEILKGPVDLLTRLNVGEIYDFINKGVDGIINAFCLNCMVGTATGAVIKRISEENGNIPIMNLVFEDQESTHIKNRVEAFIYRVKRWREEQKGSAQSSIGK